MLRCTVSKTSKLMHYVGKMQSFYVKKEVHAIVIVFETADIAAQYTTFCLL